jgi:spastin
MLSTSCCAGGDISKVVRATEGYSASDLTALCKEAALGPVRELGAAIANIRVESIRPIQLKDFENALQVRVCVWEGRGLGTVWGEKGGGGGGGGVGCGGDG